MASLTDILKSRIGKGGKSKAYVADRMGVTERTIENYLNGNRNPKPDALIKLSEILGFSLSELSEQNVPREQVSAQNSERPPDPASGKTQPEYLNLYIQSILEQKRILEDQNQFLRRNFEVSLSSIAEVQQASLVHIKALAWYSASVQVGENETRTVKRKTQTVGRNLAYTDQERDLLSAALRIEKPRLWFFTQFMYHCYIRRTELTTIRVKHIDLVNHTIIIPGETAKNNTQESVVIPRDLVPVIREMKLHRYHPEDFVFGRGLLTCGNQYKNPNQISTDHNNVVKRLGISPEKGLYSHKHTGVIAYYYATGKDIYSLMRQLRHRDLNTTMIYMKSLGLVQNDVFRNASVA